MPGPRKTPETLEILRRRQAGELPPQIAEAMGGGLTSEKVSNVCLAFGIKLTAEERASEAYKAARHKRAMQGAENSPRTQLAGFESLAARNAEIIRLRTKEKLLPFEIARKLKLSQPAVAITLRRLGLKTTPEDRQRLAHLRRTTVAKGKAAQYAEEERLYRLHEKDGRSSLWIASRYSLTRKQVLTIFNRVTNRRLLRAKVQIEEERT